MGNPANQEGAFVHSESFHAGEVSGNLELDAYEEIYEKLFAEVIEDGVITAEERQRLEKAAASLGLDRARLAQLEQALTAGYEALHGRAIQRAEAADAEALAAAAVAPSPDADLLKRRIAALEAHVVELEQELERARAQRDIEVDLSVLEPAEQPAVTEDPTTLQRRLRHDPRDVVTLHALFRAYGERSHVDGQWRVASVLVYLGAADAAERRTFDAYPQEGLIRPTRSVSAQSWQRHLFHPEDELLTGQIFASITSAVLLGRVAALRRSGSLPQLDPRHAQHVESSTIQAVRCLAWAASILGMAVPTLYADPSFPGLVQMVPGIPPATRLGRQALSGRAPGELAFLAGRYLAGFREERFVRQLFPDVLELQDLFVAALLIANPALPIDAETKARVLPVSKAVEPLLQPPQVQRLRTLFARFVEEGGRTNLQRWVRASDATALRAGLLLCNDLGVADAMLQLEDPAAATSRMNELLEFCASERYGLLRTELGLALPGAS